MPDLMGSEFKQIQEAVEIAYEWLCEGKSVSITPANMLKQSEDFQKIRAARELMVDLAGGNSR